jgi:hypothetical protein
MLNYFRTIEIRVHGTIHPTVDEEKISNRLLSKRI